MNQHSPIQVVIIKIFRFIEVWFVISFGYATGAWGDIADWWLTSLSWLAGLAVIDVLICLWKQVDEKRKEEIWRH